MGTWNKIVNELWVGNPITKNYKWNEKVTSFIFVVGFSYGAQLAASIYSRYVITNLERRYGASSQLAGNISQAYAAGATLCLIGLTLFAHKVKHKPKTTAYFICIVGLGAIFAPMAHYFGGEYDHTVVSSKSSPDSQVQIMCDTNRTMSTCDETDAFSNTFSSTTTLLRFMYAAEFCMGFGVSAMIPMSYSYIDDHSEPGKSSFYFSAIYSMFMFGIFVSSMFSSKIVKVWVDWPFSEAPENLTEKSHNWVGAWWVGYIIWSVWIFISTIPYFYFPAKLPPQYEMTEEQKEKMEMLEKEKKIEVENHGSSESDTESNAESAGGIGPYISKIWAVFQNRCFMSIIMHSVFEAFIGQAGMLFPKYLEREFDVSPSEANLLGSYRLAIVIPAVLIGGFFSSYVLKWNAQTAKKYIIGVQIFILIIESSYFLVSCENSKLVGWIEHKEPSLEGFYDVSSVDEQCGCKSGKLDKVCPENPGFESDNEGLMYLTACQAQCQDYSCIGENNVDSLEVDSHGCWEDYKEQDVVYNNCFDYGSGNHSLDMAKSFCENPVCTFGKNSHFYLVLISTIGTLIQPFLSGATTMVQFGACPPEEKVTSLAIYKLSNKMLGSLWAAKVIGWVIDQTCIVWAQDDCGNEGHCLVYDRNLYKWYYFGYTWVLSAVSLVIYSGILIFRPKKGSSAYKAWKGE